jgi:RNA polymerase sigma-70 factor (ECF subfamily)
MISKRMRRAGARILREGFRGGPPSNVRTLGRSMSAGDLELVRKMLAGDERAFAEMFDGYFPGLFRFALARVERDEDVAEEIAQVTLVAAIRKLSTYRGEAALFTWLCTFCRHEIAAHWRRARKAPVRLVDDDPLIEAALDSRLSADDTGPEAAIRREETARQVHALLDRLPPRYAAALEWKYVDGLSVQEIADRLALSVKAAESMLTRAREAFREGFTALSQARPSGDR